MIKSSRGYTHIKRLRIEAGMTQDEAARVSGVSRSTIQRWEAEIGGTSANIEALLETYHRRTP